VLIHGAWHGGWVWDEVSAELVRLGHVAVSPDLPAHGLDRTPAGEVSLEGYAAAVAAVVRDLPEPVILVGHSFGGAVISQAAELVGDRIRHLVYLCAFLLRDGQSVSRHGLGPSSTSLLTTENLLPAEHTLMVSERVIYEGLYNGCSRKTAERAAARLRPEPLVPMQTPLALMNQRARAIPQSYIECTQDRIVPLQDQRRMCRLTPPGRLLQMATGHSPFFTETGQLVEHLITIGQEVEPAPRW
jgi:pimeloyl-ACP methyl ester carboxylesterase